MTGDAWLDPEALERLRGWGGEALVGKMIALFLKNAPERMAEIRAGAATGDWDRLERGAHSLKSSAGNLGADSLRALSARMEEAAEARSDDPVDGLLAELESAFDHTLRALRETQAAASDETGEDA